MILTPGGFTMPLDPAYQTVAPEDFPAMLDPARYGRRSPHFEEIIARTEEHFWNPEDRDYIRFDEPFPTDEPILPLGFVVESHTAMWDRLDDGQRVAFANETARWLTSNLLHGEQGALSLSASLCEMFLDPGAQEYAANQVREEARHVHGFTRYMHARFGGATFPVGDTIGTLLRDLVSTQVVYKKIVGMQMLVEGLAMGAFIAARTRAHYAAWVDMDELATEKDRMVGEEVAEDGIRQLREINAGKRKIVRKIA